MRAEIFYTNDKHAALPLYLFSEATWATHKPAAIVKKFLENHKFAGKSGEFCCCYNHNGELAAVYAGCGADDWYYGLAAAALALPEGKYYLVEPIPEYCLAAFALALYKFDRYKQSSTKNVQLYVENPAEILPEVQAVFTVRDLINTPTNDMGPLQLSAACRQLAENYQGMFKEWVGDELLAANFPAIHAVGRAAAQSPRFITCTFGNPEHPHITLVGKGVCFDSGGLDIKPAEFMRLMKKDMGGAAQVIGLTELLLEKKLPIYLQVLIPAVENAVGSNSYRPGDIITMRNGLTVEVDNTDAEGRLVLADALSYAVQQNPDVIIDFATLTGAARSAVGTELSALFCNDDKLAAELVAFGVSVNDPLWRLPLYARYDKLLECTVADISNCGASPYGGAIIAALFMQRFVNKLPWVHFDIMAWNLISTPGRPAGGEAMAMRAVYTWLAATYK